MKQTLICSAWDEENKFLADSIKQDPNFVIASLGIGFLESAIKLEEVLSTNPEISQIIFLGTGGAYSHDEFNVGDIVITKDSDLLNLGDIQGISYVPLRYSTYKADEKILTKFFGYEDESRDIKAASALSSLEITQSQSNNNKIFQKFHSYKLVENMELYGVAKVAFNKKIPWVAMLGITNHTDEHAHDNWIINQETVSQAMCYKLSAIIDS